MGSGAADAMMVGSDEALARVGLLGRDAAAAAAVAAAAARDRAPAARPSSSRPDARSCDAGEERCASGWERRRGRGAALCWAPAADPGETPTAPRGRRRFPVRRSFRHARDELLAYRLAFDRRRRRVHPER
jgi:hypothetical protein